MVSGCLPPLAMGLVCRAASSRAEAGAPGDRGTCSIAAPVPAASPVDTGEPPQKTVPVLVHDAGSPQAVGVPFPTRWHNVPHHRPQWTFLGPREYLKHLPCAILQPARSEARSLCRLSAS